ncbi:MAG: F0F1 ATP synthase subunit A [Candidatus Kerfeldbacteria bacterium]|nr:F0F1 ATP synthase subunit A [Candidatus Kerfeldbacteria bacterium]
MNLSISLAAEPIAHVLGFPITNSMIGTLAAVAVIAIVARRATRRLQAVPSRWQVAAEATVDGLLGLVDSVTNDRQQTRRFFPVVATIFLFILTMNWLGLLPFFGPIGWREIEHGRETFVPFFRSGSADLNMTLAIALISVIGTQVVGILAVGAKKYGQKFLNLKNPIFTFVGLIEFISEFTKMISFSFRLFGNIFAGEVLLLVIASLVPLLAPVPFYFLEIFVGLIQAFVFALLTLVFFKIAATAEEH